MSQITIKALHMSGFEVSVPVQGTSLDAIDSAIADLIARGYRPPTTSGDGWQKTPTGEPICPRHQVVMRLRNKQNQEWWSHRVIDRQTGEELFCRGHAGASSPGWEVTP